MKEKKEAIKNIDKGNLYRLLFENHPNPLLVFHRDSLKFLSVNKAAIDFYGYSLEEFLDLTVLDIRPEEERPLMLNHLRSNPENNFIGTKKHRKKDGTIVYVDITGANILYEEAPARFISVTNVTENIKSKEALIEEEIKYKTLVETISEGIVLADNDDIIKFVNKRYCEMLGYSKEELIGKVGYEVLLDKENEELIKKKNLDRTKGITDKYEIKMKKKDGTPIDLEVSGTPVYDKSGNVIGSLGVHSDITERKKAISAIEESEQKFRSLVENSIAGVYLIQDGIFKYLNPKLADIFGYTVDELLNKKGPQFVTLPEDWETVGENLRKRVAGEIDSMHYAFRGVKKNGKTIYVEVFGSRTSYQGKPAVIGTLLDITERKEAEETLREKEENYRNLINSSGDAVYVLQDKKLVLVNPAWEKLFGISAEEATSPGFHPLRIVAEESMPFILNRFKAVDEGKFAPARYEMKGLTRSGEVKDLEVSVSEIVWQGRKAIQGIYRDITDRKRAEDVLRESEEKYRDLFELAPVGVYQSTLDGKIITANIRLAQILGYSSADELMQHNINEFYSNKKLREKLIREFEPVGTVAGIELEWLKKDGEKIWVQLDAHVIKNSGKNKPYFEGFVRDISDRKKAELELIKAKENAEEANRLKSAFLSMVSHEIRSPLNAILGFSSILKEVYYDSAGQEDKQLFISMEEAGNRLLDTITHVLDISRLEADDFSLNIKPLSINKCIGSAYNVLHLQAEKKKLEMKMLLPAEEIIINTDEYCLGGVLVNLLSNAIKYSNKGTITTELTCDNNSVICSVMDQGIGMSEEYKKHLFETFSQEDVGLSRRFEGTGLGLAITKRYLELLGGTIDVKSKKGEGTTMTFRLPKNI